MRFDEVCKYAGGVANRLMSQALKEALNGNPMYNKEDVGDIADVDITKMGLKELAKLHQCLKPSRRR